MRVLQIIPYFLPSTDFGGPTQVCAKLSAWLATRGHSVTVLTTDVASRTARVPMLDEHIDAVRVVRTRNVSQRLVQQNLYTPWHFKRTLMSLLSACDLVHIHDFYTWLTYQGAIQADALGIPVVLSGHAALSVAAERGRLGVKHLWMALLGRRSIASATVVQAATAYEQRASIDAGVPAAKVRIIPQGVTAPPRSGDGSAFRAAHGLGTRPLLLFVGRLLTSKGVDLLLAAAESLSNHPARPMFVLVGPAENRPDLATPGVRGAGNVLLTGPLDQRALQDAYAAASAFVLPSFAEGMPVSVLDALAFGLPCVISRACNLPEVADVDAGILVDTTDDSLLTGLIRLLERSREWREMGERARALAAQRFAIEDIHARYEQLYEELVTTARTSEYQRRKANS